MVSFPSREQGEPGRDVEKVTILYVVGFGDGISLSSISSIGLTGITTRPYLGGELCMSCTMA